MEIVHNFWIFNFYTMYKKNYFAILNPNTVSYVPKDYEFMGECFCYWQKQIYLQFHLFDRIIFIIPNTFEL